jgi:hypothetical protein
MRIWIMESAEVATSADSIFHIATPKKINMLRGCFTSILRGLLKIFK